MAKKINELKLNGGLLFVWISGSYGKFVGCLSFCGDEDVDDDDEATANFCAPMLPVGPRPFDSGGRMVAVVGIVGVDSRGLQLLLLLLTSIKFVASIFWMYSGCRLKPFVVDVEKSFSIKPESFSYLIGLENRFAIN